MSQAKFLWSPKSAWGCQSKTTHPQTHIKSDKTFPLKSSSNRSHVIFSSVSGHLGHFYVLTVVQSVARNTGMQRTFLIMVFSRSTPSSGISGSHGSFISSFLRNLHSDYTDEWMKKMWYIYIMKYYSVVKKESNL